MSGLPEVDRGALVLADLAWIEAGGSAADRTKAAVRAYLWAVEAADATGFYPSLTALREALATPDRPAEPRDTESLED